MASRETKRSPLPFPRFVARWRLALGVAALLTISGLAVSIQAHPSTAIVLATTTSARDTGLLDYLDPLFTVDTGIQVRYVAVGTGQALDIARRGDADVTMVHAPSLEVPFMQSGDGLCRSAVMYDQFLVVGPLSDPAGIRGLANATEAFRRVWQTQSLFFSRADASGTYVKELALWALAGYTPTTTNDSWYIETGQGMAATLTIASEKGGYTLTDDGTFYALAASLNLAILASGDPFLFNQYSMIVVNPQTHPTVNAAAALEYARWLTSPRGQTLIADYEVGGHRIYTADFNPNAAGAC